MCEVQMELERLPEEVQVIPIESIQWEAEMKADPRDYTISEYNARLEDPERNLVRLEDSILELGFRKPLLSDENKEIIDGGRRLRIALKHSIYIPVIHRKYEHLGDYTAAFKAVDSILGNDAEPNTARELATVVDMLIERGYGITEVARMLGRQPSHLVQWAISIHAPADVFPEEDEEAKDTFEHMTPRRKKQVIRILGKKNLAPVEAAKELKQYAELHYSDQDSYEKDVHSGTGTDLEARVELVKSADTELWTTRFYGPYARAWRRKIAMRGWDRQSYETVVHNAFTLGEIEITQEMYLRLKKDDVQFE